MAPTTPRARFAPSPTGTLHVGGARTALFNWLFARHAGGAFVLRLEDTDTERSAGEYEAGFLEDLRWLGLDWDEGPDIGGPHAPYRQSERLQTYKYAAERLLKDGKAYKCYCTAEEVRLRREQAIAEGRPAVYDGRCKELTSDRRRSFECEGRAPSLRYAVDYEEIVHKDIIRGDVSFKTGMVGDFVILRSDGMPTYNFACAVDDSTMAITHVIRGEEHLPNTLRQILLYRGLGLHPPEFAHLPLVLGPDRTKLSKRHGATSVGEMRRIGYPAVALLNYLALLGWSPGDDTELMDREELVSRFSLDRVSASPSIFDANKLEWVSSHHMKTLSPEELLEGVAPFLDDGRVGAGDRDLMMRAVSSLGVTAKKYPDLAAKVAVFLEGPAARDRALIDKMRSEGGRRAIGLFAEAISRIDRPDRDAVREALAGVLETSGLRKGEVFLPIRVALTGRRSGPEIPIIVEVLGKQRTVELLKAAGESEADT